MDTKFKQGIDFNFTFKEDLFAWFTFGQGQSDKLWRAAY